jgi:hypothetical protein
MYWLLILSFFTTKIYGQTLSDELKSPIIDQSNQYLLATGTLLTLSTVFFENELDRSHRNLKHKKPLGDLAIAGNTYGKLVPNILYSGYFGINYLLNDNTTSYKRTMGMFKATAYSAALTTILKYTLREPRPNNSGERNSFPSGHATTAFAFSSYVYNEHGWKYGLPAMMLATLTAVSRINNNMHTHRDVIAGATIGTVFGLGISKLQNTKDLGITPVVDKTTSGLYLNYYF